MAEKKSNMPVSTYDQVMCAMCGGTRTQKRFCLKEHAPGPGDVGIGPDITRMGGPMPRHLHRTCEACGFEWVTETLEAMIERAIESGRQGK